jgi:putative oxidoreductase
MAAYGVPGALLPFAVAIELGCGALIIVGWQTRLAALALSGFCLIAAAIFHTKFSDANQVLHFAKDIALAGAFLFVAGRGAGRFSVDAAFARSREQTLRQPVLSQAPACYIPAAHRTDESGKGSRA